MFYTDKYDRVILSLFQIFFSVLFGIAEISYSIG